MTTISHDFLKTGFKWDQIDLQDLKFNFASSTPLYLFIEPDFLSNFANLGNSSQFSALSDSSLYDQQDVVRYLLSDPSDLSGFSGIETVNSSLVNTANKLVNGSTVNYRVSFADVIDASFSEDVNGKMQLVNHDGESSASRSIAFLPQNTSAGGDVVINQLDPGHDDLKPGQIGFWLHLHELGHAIGGLEDVRNTTIPSDPNLKYLDNQKYTIMSDKAYGEFGATGVATSGTEVYASGLQLLDIAALRDTYGETGITDTRNEDTDGDPATTGTIYALGQGLGFDGALATDAFLYTIWDGGGDDTIDVSGFSSLGFGAEIDLREGHFSSIGVDGNGNPWARDAQAITGVDPDPGNVAIAYGTRIENAIGTDHDDNLIGNDQDNVIEGKDGNDTLFGSAGSDTLNGGAENDEGGDTADYSKFSGTVTSVNLVNGNGTVTKSDGTTDTLIDIENITGTDGNDDLQGGAGNNVLDGQDGDDQINGGSGSDILYGGAGNDTLGFNLSSAVSYSTAFGGSGVDYFKPTGNGSVFLTADGTVRTQAGVATEVEGLDLSTSNDNQYVTIADLGFNYDVGGASATSWLDYSVVSDQLTFDLNGNWTVTENSGLEVDSYLNSASTLVQAIGSTNGDSVLFGGSAQQRFWLGTGDDIVTFALGTTGTKQLYYSGGTDIVEEAYRLNELRFDPTIQDADLSFSEINKGPVTNFSGGGNFWREYEYDLKITALGKGSITLEGLTKTEFAGPDDVFGTSDDSASHNGPVVKLWNGASYSEDDYSLIGAGSFTIVDFTPFDDAVTGSSSNDTFYGLGGNDSISGLAGNDSLYGEGGSDTLNGGAGDDELYGGLGIDTLNGGADSDDLYGSEGNDILNGDGGDDYLYGQNDNDTLNGGDGTDRLYGGSGADTLNGNLGDDYLYGDEGDDALNGDEGNDDLFGGIGNDTLRGGAGNDNLYSGTSSTGGDFAGSTNWLYGEAGNDVLRGHEGNDILDGGDGDDTVLGGEGDDTLIGSKGADTLRGEEGNNTYLFEAGFGSATTTGALTVAPSTDGFDTISFGASVNTSDVYIWLDRITHDLFLQIGDNADDLVFLDGSNSLIDGRSQILSQIDQISFHDGTVWDLSQGGIYINDTNDGHGLLGTDFDDNILGNGGDDTILALDGNDTLSGNAGNDTLIGRDGDDTLIGGTGNDILRGDGGIDTAIFSGVFANYTITGSSTLTVQDNVGTDGTDTVFSTVEKLEFSDGVYESGVFTSNTITIDGTAAGETINGTAANEIINGLGGNDFLRGGAGTDTLNGGDGDDDIRGQEGNDILNGGAGADKLFGGFNGSDTYSSNDELYGDGGNDILYGLLGDDLLNGGDDNDDLFGGDGVDTLNGNAGADRLYGGNGNDILSGGTENDLLRGEGNDDTLSGGDGVDNLYGGNGNDTLRGGAGSDFLWGQADNDIFVFDTLDTFDKVMDFNVTDDRLDISEILDTTTWDGTIASINDYVALTQSGSFLYVGVDADGAGIASSNVNIARLTHTSTWTDAADMAGNDLIDTTGTLII